MTYVVGLTGGIGSGKTVVSDYFMELGVPVIDTDVIARTVVEPGTPAQKALVKEFGEGILQADGTLDRDRLRNIAFASAENKARLDAITHPTIREETFAQVRAVQYPYCIVVVPLLTAESPFSEFMQRVLVVTSEHHTRIQRVKKRSKLTEAEIERIIATQLSDDKRADFADDIIANDGTIADAQAEVEKLHQIYLSLSSSE